MDFAHPRGCGGFGSVDLFDPQAGLVLVEVLTGHAGAIVVGPNERLAAAVHVIEPVRMLDFVADVPEVGSLRELVERKRPLRSVLCARTEQRYRSHYFVNTRCVIRPVSGSIVHEKPSQEAHFDPASVGMTGLA
jgi:hypothetical protein